MVSKRNASNVLGRRTAEVGRRFACEANRSLRKSTGTRGTELTLARVRGD
ncbi:MAG: hypothetical protein ACTS6H_01455 [Candidatus Hodgkinia cicadicola]